MASNRLRDNGKFCAQIRLSGSPAISRTFADLKSAIAWAEAQESALRSQEATVPESEQTLLSIGRRCCDTQLKGKASRHHMLGRIERMAQSFRQSFLSISRTDVNNYKNKRMLQLSGSTVREEVQTINKLFRWAEREMIFGEEPVLFSASNIALPPPSKPRSRIVERYELDRLMSDLNPVIAEIVELAYETAMRRAEITKLVTRHLNLDKRMLVVEDGKLVTEFYH